jgi:hypothetical protein
MFLCFKFPYSPPRLAPLSKSEFGIAVEDARKILRWYSYRWRVEEYHKLLKSGCQAESYRLAAEGMKPLLGFLCV